MNWIIKNRGLLKRKKNRIDVKDTSGSVTADPVLKFYPVLPAPRRRAFVPPRRRPFTPMRWRWRPFAPIVVTPISTSAWAIAGKLSITARTKINFFIRNLTTCWSGNAKVHPPIWLFYRNLSHLLRPHILLTNASNQTYINHFANALTTKNNLLILNK